MTSRKSVQASPTTKLTKEKTYPWPKETFPQITPVPEAAATTRIARMLLLAIYFWSGCFAYVVIA